MTIDDLFWICCTTCSYSCTAVNQISTDTAHRVSICSSRASCFSPGRAVSPVCQCVCMPVFLCIQIVSFQLNDL